jgi:hypothetical protein
MQKELAARNVVLLPLLLDRVELPPFLRDKLYADFTDPEKFEVTFPALLRALGVEPESRAQYVEPEERTPPQEGKATAHPDSTVARSARRLAEFSDVRIVALDDSKSFKPDDTKTLYNLYLELSDAPPEEWQRIFDAERSFPRHTMWRKAWIEGGFIVLYCAPDELEKYHLEDLKTDVRNANSKYREYLISLAREEVRQREQMTAEQNTLRDLKGRLKFD